MHARTTLKVVALGALALSLVACVVGVQAQRRRPSRRATHPVRPASVPTPSPLATPAGGEPRLVSSADDQQQDDASRGAANTNANTRRGAAGQADADASNRAVRQLSNEVTQLNKRLNEMDRQRQTDLLQERLTRAEQRVEAVQTQLTDVMEKQANLQSRVDQIDEAARPENLDRQVATVGTFRPDEARDSLRRQYDNEKKRVQAQLEVQNARRTQLEKSLSDATQLADRYRAELDDALRREAEEGGAPGATAAPSPRPPRATATPEPTPTPPQIQ
jgi:CRISPR/Cas system-associated exonuclease Cas4 (RecB family)